MISRNDGQEEECDERDGWCLSHTSDDLRDIMSSMIKQVIRAKRSGETSLSLTLVQHSPMIDLAEFDFMVFRGF